MKRIKIFFAVVLCKTIHFLAGLLGRGSSIPGAITLKLFPDILSLITLPEKVVAVTGSNGKTSTVEMIAHILKAGGKTVAYNKEGSNQIEGVTTCLLCNSTLFGKVKSDVVLLESDERFARHTFKHFHPTDYIITNLYRDQLTRNGHPEWVYGVISESIYPETRLILNADDPLVSKFGYGREGTLYFGADHVSFDSDTNDSIYNDGKYCPVCGERMEYEYYHYNHIGKYKCTSCDYHRMDTTWSLTNADLKNGTITINNEFTLSLPFSSLYQCYNTMAAFAASEICGVEPSVAISAMEQFHLKSGRIMTFDLVDGERTVTGTLLTSKHENSISYDQSIRVVTGSENDTTVMIIVDAVSRKYFTSETSWLWDIDFEMLNSDNVKRVVLAGKYCYDLASRFAFTGIPKEKIGVYETVAKGAKDFAESDTEEHYVVTCFSDKGKFTSLENVTVTGGI